MKVVFNGILERSSGGCVPCGRKRTSELSMKSQKLYILPSGKTQRFRVGIPVEVTDEDGEFLMSYMYTDQNGEKQTVFTEVN